MEEKDRIETLKKFKEKSGWSFEKIAQNIGVHSQAVQAWFRGTKPNNLTKRAIWKFLNKYSRIVLNLIYMSSQANEFVKVKIKAIPLLADEAKWAILGDSLHYEYEEFRKMLPEISFKEGDILEIYIIKEEKDQLQLEPIRINISKDWPTDLHGGKVVDAIATVNISNQMDKLGFL